MVDCYSLLWIVSTKCVNRKRTYFGRKAAALFDVLFLPMLRGTEAEEGAAVAELPFDLESSIEHFYDGNFKSRSIAVLLVRFACMGRVFNGCSIAAYFSVGEPSYLLVVRYSIMSTQEMRLPSSNSIFSMPWNILCFDF